MTKYTMMFLLSALFLVGCESKDVFNSSTNDTAPDTGTSQAAAVTLVAAPSSKMGTSPGDSVSITASVVDSGNVALGSAPVSFATTSGVLAASGATTDGNGQVSATLSPGTDQSNRTITVTATAGTTSGSITITAEGTSISLSGPSSAVANGSVDLTLTLLDSSNTPVPNAPVQVTSAQQNTLTYTNGSAVTDDDGHLGITVSNLAAAAETISVSALGATASHPIAVSNTSFALTVPSTDVALGVCAPITVTWVDGGVAKAGEVINFSLSRGDLFSAVGCGTSATSATTTASGIATIYAKSAQAGQTQVDASAVSDGTTTSDTFDFIATEPGKLEFQTSAATLAPGGTVTLTARVRDINDNLVKGQAVQFKIVSDTSGSILTSTTATTDSYGLATTVFQAGAVASAFEGVIVSATVVSVPSLTKTVSLTINQSAAGISLGMDTKITSQEATYEYGGSVVVADSAGNAIANQTVTLTLKPTRYETGDFGTILGATPDDDYFGRIAVSTGSDVALSYSPPLGCQNEDLNGNGQLDAGEDANLNGNLEPSVVASIDTQITTDAYGRASFSIVYVKDYSFWTQVKITATTVVNGTESNRELEFILPMSTEDEDSPPALTSPYNTYNAGVLVKDC